MKLTKLPFINVIFLIILSFISYAVTFSNPPPAYAQYEGNIPGVCTCAPTCGGGADHLCDSEGSLCCYLACTTDRVCSGNPPNNTCYNGNDVQQCYYYGGSENCTPTYAGTNTETVPNCTGPGVCNNGVCIPWCSAGNQYTACNADGKVGANTTCNTNNADENCTYTTAPGFGTNCVQDACPNKACTFNSCQLPQFECLNGGPPCTQYFSISGDITDADGNGTPNIPVNCAGQGSAGGAFTFGYGDKIKKGTYNCALALPQNYIAINPASGALPAFNVGPDKTGENFTVARVFQITGKIVDTTSPSTPNIPVTCTSSRAGAGTASGGNFTIPYADHLRAGTITCTLNLPQNYIATNPASGTITLTAGGNADPPAITFNVARVYQITGKIVDTTSPSTPNIPVTCTSSGGGAGTANGGNFTIPYADHLRAGTITCALNLPADYIATNPASGTIAVTATGNNDPAAITFNVARVYQITGKIVDTTSPSTPNIPVTCTSSGGGAGTANGGNFTIPYADHLRAGTITCALNLPADYIATNPASGTIAVTATGNNDPPAITFNVARVYQITGNIIDVDGNGTPAIPVTCTSSGGGAGTANGGNFTIPYADHLRAGTITCTLNLPQNYIAINPASGTIAVTATGNNDPAAITFNVARVFSITGEIIDVDGNGPTNIAVTCADAGPGGETATLNGGDFTFPYGDHFRRGEVTCTLALPANYIAINPVPPTIAFGVGPDRVGVEFDVARVFSVSGVVTDPYNGNAGVGGVVITSNDYAVETNGAGAYTIPYAAHLRRGTHPVVLTIPAGWTNTTVTTQNVTVGPDAVGINFGVTKLFSVSGNVFIDPNIDGIEEAGEVNYTAQVSHLGYLATLLGISNFQPNPPTPFTTGNGAYTINQLITGPITVSYALPNPPPIWYMTSPIDGPPPSFQANVGYTCNVNGAPGAACNNGNIVNLDFGIIDNVPWIQSTCGDMRNDSGINDQIPIAHYALIANASCAGPGLAFTGNTDSNFGDGQASTTNQVVGGATYPEVYTSASQITTSYTYLNQKAQTAQIPEIALSSVCNITNCTLPANLTHGIYTANGNVTLNAYTFPVNQNYVFLINGNLTIQGNIQIPVGSTAIFATANNITITANVGSTQAVTTSNLDGWYVAGNSFITNSTMPGNCDLRLNMAGSVVVNAEGTGGTMQNNRNLCAGNALYPSLSILPRLDFLLNAPEFVQDEQTVSQELAP